MLNEKAVAKKRKPKIKCSVMLKNTVIRGQSVYKHSIWIPVTAEEFKYLQNAKKIAGIRKK